MQTGFGGKSPSISESGTTRRQRGKENGWYACLHRYLVIIASLFMGAGSVQIVGYTWLSSNVFKRIKQGMIDAG